MTDSICPLCGRSGQQYYRFQRKKAGERSFSLCEECAFVFQDQETLPPEDEEKERYELHINDPEDRGYRNWLEGFINAAVTPWYEDGVILDYGSGPCPVLSSLLAARGLPVVSYDPYFSPLWPDEEPFSLILLCEVLEHINNPVADFQRLADAAGEGAVLSVMTQFLPSLDRNDFKSWWYKEDPTHIRFYSPVSLEILGEKTGWNLISENNRSLAVYRKK